MYQKITVNMYQKTDEIKNCDIEKGSQDTIQELDFTRIPALKNTSENIDLVFLIRLMLEYGTKNMRYVNAMDKIWCTMAQNELLSLVENLR